MSPTGPTLFDLPADIKYLLLQSSTHVSIKDLFHLSSPNREFYTIFLRYETALLVGALRATAGRDYMLPLLVLASAPPRALRRFSLRKLKEVSSHIRNNMRDTPKAVLRKVFSISKDIDTLCSFCLYDLMRDGDLRQIEYNRGPELSDWREAAYHFAIQMGFSSALYHKVEGKPTPTDKTFTTNLLLPTSFKSSINYPRPSFHLAFSMSPSFGLREIERDFRHAETHLDYSSPAISKDTLNYRLYIEQAIGEIWSNLRDEYGLTRHDRFHFYNPDHEPSLRARGDAFWLLWEKMEGMFRRNGDWRLSVRIMRCCGPFMEFVEKGHQAGPWLDYEFGSLEENEAMEKLRWEWFVGNRVEVEWKLRRCLLRMQSLSGMERDDESDDDCSEDFYKPEF